MFELNSNGIKQDQNGLPASLQDQMVLAWQIFRTDIWNHCRFIINNVIALLCVYMIRQRVIIRQFMCCRLVPAPESHSRPRRPPITLNSSRVYVDWLVKWGVEPFCVQILLINSWLMKLLGGKKNHSYLLSSCESSWVCVHFCPNLGWSVLEDYRWSLSEMMLRYAHN